MITAKITDQRSTCVHKNTDINIISITVLFSKRGSVCVLMWHWLTLFHFRPPAEHPLHDASQPLKKEKNVDLTNVGYLRPLWHFSSTVKKARSGASSLALLEGQRQRLNGGVQNSPVQLTIRTSTWWPSSCQTAAVWRHFAGLSWLQHVFGSEFNLQHHSLMKAFTSEKTMCQQQCHKCCPSRRSNRKVKKLNNNHHLGDGALQRAPWLDVMVFVIGCSLLLLFYYNLRYSMIMLSRWLDTSRYSIVDGRWSILGDRRIKPKFKNCRDWF